MLVERIAYRWAKAFYELTEELQMTALMKEEVESFLSLLHQSKELQNFFRSPVISKDKKIAVFQKVFKDSINELLYRYINKLIQYRREDILHQILRAYLEYYYDRKGIVIARVESAVPLLEEEKEKLKQRLREALNADVVFEEKIKPELIGGFRVFIKDKLLDETILHKLNNLRKKFSLKPYIEVI